MIRNSLALKRLSSTNRSRPSAIYSGWTWLYIAATGKMTLPNASVHLTRSSTSRFGAGITEVVGRGQPGGLLRSESYDISKPASARRTRDRQDVGTYVVFTVSHVSGISRIDIGGGGLSYAPAWASGSPYPTLAVANSREIPALCCRSDGSTATCSIVSMSIWQRGIAASTFET